MSSCMYYLTLEYFFLGLMKYSDSDNANVLFFYISHTISHIFYFMFLVIYFYMVYIS